jgi:hypothetical protein
MVAGLTRRLEKAVARDDLAVSANEDGLHEAKGLNESLELLDVLWGVGA